MPAPTITQELKRDLQLLKVFVSDCSTSSGSSGSGFRV